MKELSIPVSEHKINIPKRLILPLYSYTKGFYVYEKSGLNQWNAGGRTRNLDEVYIPFPSFIKQDFDDFFPNRNEPFVVKLPNNSEISMKVCQDRGKALMSNPNQALGKWLLRDVLNIPHGKLVTYEMLQEIGIDSVIFEKAGNDYRLDFKKLGSFDEFVNNELLVDIDHY